ncbi:MAG TPA: NADH-quinone oxidoreductase subunit N, partial [Stellaceae bacterium]|nr:NADH-quinone oxidoreductase subunit N [Stellaceae bacterium]
TKFYIFFAAIDAGFYGLAVIGVLASVVAAYYYVRIVKVMYFDEGAPGFDRPSPVVGAVLAISAVLILLFFVFPAPLTDSATAAAATLFSE